MAASGVGIAAFSSAGAGASPQPTAAAPTPVVSWQACPQYSDAVLDYLGIGPEDYPAFRAMLARMDCGTVRVPQDYRNPGGAKVTIALTRIKATDQAHRLGSLAMNPGGPGGSGYLMPEQLLLGNSTVAQLNQQYDLIGFDPRGIGYSTSYDCPQTRDGDDGDDEPPAGPVTRAEAKKEYEAEAQQNASCSSSNPAFLSQLTTANVARDLDQIRRGLGERKMSYFGGSWGTQLGAVYRSMFGGTIGRMWLDSVVSPRAYDLHYRFSFTARTTEQDFALFASWLAERDSTYGLGDTPAKVTATVRGLRQAADAEPWQFSDVPIPLDGAFIAFLASAPNVLWDQAAPILQAMTTAVRGGAAPAAVKDVVGDGGGGEDPTPDGAPERSNRTAGNAFLCNEDSSARDFDSLWNEYKRNLQQNPITGDATSVRPNCAGWTLPVQSFQLRRNNGSLVMSGHRYETLTPYPWVGQMQDTIGGQVFTVDDWIHGSAAMVPECATHIVSYFSTGNPDGNSCPGVQPRSPDEDTATAAAATVTADNTSATSTRLTWPKPSSKH
ncbi:alpha/beta fold hydrolase [Streptomyces sp. NBC_01615]|uniref:alpha/beta fold hydrolase n=1 Tax=Streptomyces sp. NBC_01615 TaxID=2975898 RepID=UPI003863FB51